MAEYKGSAGEAYDLAEAARIKARDTNYTNLINSIWKDRTEINHREITAEILSAQAAYGRAVEADKKKADLLGATRSVRGVSRPDLAPLFAPVAPLTNGIYYSDPSAGYLNAYHQYTSEVDARKEGYDSYADKVNNYNLVKTYTDLLDKAPSGYKYKFTSNTGGSPVTTAELQTAVSGLYGAIAEDNAYQAAAKTYYEKKKPAGFSYDFKYDATKAESTAAFNAAVAAADKLQEVTDRFTKLNKPASFSFKFTENADMPTYQSDLEKAIVGIKEAQVKETVAGNKNEYGTTEWDTEQTRNKMKAGKYQPLDTPFNKMLVTQHKLQPNPNLAGSSDWFDKETSNITGAMALQQNWHNAEKQKKGIPLTNPIYSTYVGDVATTPEQRAWHGQQQALHQSKRVGKYGGKKKKSYTSLIDESIFGKKPAVKLKVYKADGDGLMDEILYGKKPKSKPKLKSKTAAKKKPVKRMDFRNCGI